MKNIPDYLNNPLAWDIGQEKQSNKQIEENAIKQAEVDTMYLECFKTKAGKAVLEHLRKNTIEAATWMASLEYNKAVAHGFAREGQNALVKMIEIRVERAKRKP